MHELHQAAGRRIASLIGVEAAHICAGAAAGMAVMAAACMAGADPARIARLPDTTGMKSKFVTQRAHGNPFARALGLAGGRLVEVDPDPGALARAIDGETVAVFDTLAWFCAGPAVPLPELAAIAHRAGVPLIVDAAAEVPPAENLTRFLAEGADLVTFSGGKVIRGPQASGLILGRKDLIEACRLNDCPNMSMGRAMKVGKEEIVGLVKAVELYVAQDHAAQRSVWEGRVARMLEVLSPLPHVRAWRQFPEGEGQKVPHVALTWDERALGITYRAFAKRLRDGRPRIAVLVIYPEDPENAGLKAPQVRIQPHMLVEGQELLVARRMKELLCQSS